MLLDLLCDQLLTHSVVPHVPRVNVGQVLSARAQKLSLLRASHIIVEPIEGAISDVLFNFLLDRLTLLALCFGHVSVKGNKVNFL